MNRFFVLSQEVKMKHEYSSTIPAIQTLQTPAHGASALRDLALPIVWSGVSAAVGAAAGWAIGWVLSWLQFETNATDWAPVGSAVSAAACWWWLLRRHAVLIERQPTPALIGWPPATEYAQDSEPDDPQQELTLTLDAVDMPGYRRQSILHIEGVDDGRLLAWAEAVAGGASLSVNQWTGAHRAFSRSEYESLLSELARAGLAVKGQGSQGWQLTAAGRAVIRRLAAIGG
jgi:hypothetical protein